jgi:hypothetical protein
MEVRGGFAPAGATRAFRSPWTFGGDTTKGLSGSPLETFGDLRGPSEDCNEEGL